MNEIKNIIKNLKTEYEKKYGFSLFEVEFNTEITPTLSGKVLLETQAREVMKRVKAIYPGKLDDKILILADWQKKSEISWGKTKSIPLNVYRFPPFLAGENSLNTQIYDKDENFRILYEKENSYLIQCIDFTLGWVEAGKVEELEEDKRESWQVLRAEKDRVISVAEGWKSELLAKAEVFLGVEYLWGGTTKAGIDCSGFTQRVFREVLGLYLPKHSGDQRKLGKRVSLKNIQFGDLLFLKSLEKNLSHVALYFDHETVIHASLGQKKVVRESLSKVLEDHRFIALRRVCEL